MIRRISHLGLAVRDLDAAIRLYQDVFGLELEHRWVAEGAGLEVIDRAPRSGGDGRTLVGFLHPKGVHGVLTELEQDVRRQ
jgi:catechol 2,3-dioxygenase-like lactoylglutathione lyase family enzyme